MKIRYLLNAYYYTQDILSHRNVKTKRGKVIAFFLEVFRISNSQFLDEECEHIPRAFHLLQFSLLFIRDHRKRGKKVAGDKDRLLEKNIQDKHLNFLNETRV